MKGQPNRAKIIWQIEGGETSILSSFQRVWSTFFPRCRGWLTALSRKVGTLGAEQGGWRQSSENVLSARARPPSLPLPGSGLHLSTNSFTHPLIYQSSIHASLISS